MINFAKLLSGCMHKTNLQIVSKKKSLYQDQVIWPESNTAPILFLSIGWNSTARHNILWFFFINIMLLLSIWTGETISKYFNRLIFQVRIIKLTKFKVLTNSYPAIWSPNTGFFSHLKGDEPMKDMRDTIQPNYFLWLLD